MINVQYSGDGITWFDAVKLQSRAKPEPIRFRNYIRFSPSLGRNVADITEYERTAEMIGFVRWLGDWQEVEA